MEHRGPSEFRSRPPEPTEAPGRGTVYIVDPDDGTRARLEKLLRLRGLHVRSFASAEGFLAVYDGPRTACLVVEADLPGLGGIDLLESLGPRHARPPAIVLSASGSVPTAVRALRAGAVDFVEKPFVPHVLVRQVCETLRRRYRSTAVPRRPESPS
jgi:two-component system response regulator FixJ